MKGFTLVEILIAVTLGAMVTGAVLHVFLIIHHNLMTQLGIARIAENARAIDTLLGKAIRTSGHFGCVHLDKTLPLRIHDGVSEHFGLQAKSALIVTTKEKIQKNPLLAQRHRAKMRENSDVLWITSINERGRNHFKKNKIAVLSDCSQADVFKIIDLESASNKVFPFFQKTTLLSKHYRENAKLGILHSAIYYVGKTSRFNATHQPIYALYRSDLNGVTTELVEGIENMKVLEHTPSSIKMAVLLNSIEDASLKPQPDYPSDRLIRKWIEFEWDIKVLS